MSMKINYLGMELKNPLVLSASPFTHHIDACKALEDHGIGAIVMHSLYEEAINQELHEIDHMLFHGKDAFSEALHFFPESDFENYEAHNYLEQIARLKESLDIPVIASLNGVSLGGWVKYAKLIEEAGADALELNLYYPAADPSIDSMQIEADYLEVIEAITSLCELPLSLKVTPYFSALPNFLSKAQQKGARGAVFFNHLYLPNIDLESLEWSKNLYHAHPGDFLQALRNVAICHGKIGMDLAISGGLQRGEDLIKAVMAGANIVEAATIFHEYGAEAAKWILRTAQEWVELMGYESLKQMQGVIALDKSPNPDALLRSSYVHLLHESDGLWFSR